jgi:type IV pilus assembly protein PilQ
MNKHKTVYMVMAATAFICGTAFSQRGMPMPPRMPAPVPAKAVKDTVVVKNAAQPRMTFDFKDTDIRDIVRSVSIAYGLNIVIDKDIAAKVTIHLTDVPVLDGLRTILTAHGLALVQEGSMYRIAKAEDRGSGAIAVPKRDTLNIDIDNMEVRDFIKDISAKTGINIIAEKGVEGRINGLLRNINVDDGIRALFEANGFVTRYRGDILIVSAKDQTAQGGRFTGGQPGNPVRGQNQGQQLDVRVRDRKVSLNLTNADLGDALKEIADQGKFNYITYGDVRGQVNAKLDNVPVEKAIGLLMSGTNYSFAIRDSILLVGDRNSATPSGQALSTSALLHLKHIKADNFLAILPKSIPSSNIQLVKEQNAVLVTGTMDLINQINDFISRVDIPTPQIMIEVVVVEFTRNNGSDIGIDAGKGTHSDTSGQTFIPSILLTNSGKSINQQLDKSGIFKFSTIGLLPDDFWIKLHAMETQKKAKVMAQPRIATLNGNKASINVGVTSYFKLAGGTDLNPLVRFQEIKSGIKVDITPWISQGGQVTVEINPDISNSIGNNEKDGYPDISSRSINTTIQLNDGETIILGGLIQAQDSKSTSKVPILGDIPLLGKLFQSESVQKTSSELVIYLTPHILTRADTVNINQDLEQFKIRMQSNREALDEGIREKPAGRDTTPVK